SVAPPTPAACIKLAPTSEADSVRPAGGVDRRSSEPGPACRTFFYSLGRPSPMVWKRRKELLEELAMVLVKVKAIQFGTFTLVSGRISPLYIDLRTIPSYPGAYRTLTGVYGEYLKHEFKE